MNTRVLEREMKESVTKFSSIFCFMLFILVSPPSAMAKGDPEAGKAKSAVCAACHGQQGQGMGMFPALAGRDSEYIIDRLTTYKNRGEVGRMSATMWSQASLLSDQDIETLGKFIEETMITVSMIVL